MNRSDQTPQRRSSFNGDRQKTARSRGSALPADVVAAEAEFHRRLLEQTVNVLRDAPPASAFKGRGIVLCAGGDVYFPSAWICISMLRRTGCTLPVEVWYRGRREMTPQAIALLESLGARCIDAQDVARREQYRRLDTWEIKALAVAYSSFQEVLYLDADNVPLRNPEYLFDSAPYRQHGALFWPDRYAGVGRGLPWLRRAAWSVCNVPHRDEPELEAGQLVVDKSRCWPALALTLFLNSHSDYYYRFFYGDKDTFHLAWRRMETPYALVPHPPLDLGRSEAMLQHDPGGTPLFEHRCFGKWSLSHPTRTIAGARTEAAARELLEQLRVLWSPPMRRFPEELTTSERETYALICAARVFTYSAERISRRRVELRPNFRVAGAGQPLTWMVEEDLYGEMTLAIGPRGEPAVLRRDGRGAWTGRAFRTFRRATVELTQA